MKQFGVITKTRALVNRVCKIWSGHCLQVVPCVLPVCPIFLGMKNLRRFCRSIMGFYIFGCRIYVKQLQTIINCLLLLELNMTIRMLGESCPQVVFQVTLIGEVKRLPEGHDLTVDCRGVGRKDGSIVDVEDEKDSPLNKKAGVHLGLAESPGEEPSLDVLVPGDLESFRPYKFFWSFKRCWLGSTPWMVVPLGSYMKMSILTSACVYAMTKSMDCMCHPNSRASMNTHRTIVHETMGAKLVQ